MPSASGDFEGETPLDHREMTNCVNLGLCLAEIKMNIKWKANEMNLRLLQMVELEVGGEIPKENTNTFHKLYALWCVCY